MHSMWWKEHGLNILEVEAADLIVIRGRVIKSKYTRPDGSFAVIEGKIVPLPKDPKERLVKPSAWYQRDRWLLFAQGGRMTIVERRAQLVRDQRNLTEVYRTMYGKGDSAELLAKIMRQEFEAIWDVLGEHEIILNRIVGALEKVAGK